MRFSALSGRNVAVWGVGRETQAFLRQVRERLPETTVDAVVLDKPDDAAIRLLRDERLLSADATVIGPSDLATSARCWDALVRSPGVSVHRDELVALRKSGVEVTTPTGLWLAEREGKNVVAVTGTKGKSTTSMALHHILAGAGVDTDLVGNIGRPAIGLVGQRSDRWAVLELSSYQIADLAVGPQVAGLTNIYKEHTDWHRGEAAYRRDKLRLFALPEVRDVVCGPDVVDLNLAPRAVVHQFGTRDGWHVEGGGVAHPDGTHISAEELPLRGLHNALNICVALTLVDAMGFARPALPAGLSAISPLPHRLETVWSEGGVDWVDDSISTTPESTLAALEAHRGRFVILLAGGQDRDQDYGRLGEEIASQGLIVIGMHSTGARVVMAARDAGAPDESAILVADLPAAVAEARRLCPPGAVVLLSPAAPSYDAYRDFEQRGDHFADLAAGRSA
jgi:UDP-N-acetylmuramoylalanine--D-glutamate ligase